MIYSLGTALLAVSDSALIYHLSNGVLLGIGVGATTFSVVLGAVSNNVSDKHRSLALGIASAGGSLGQFIYAIAGNLLNQSYGLDGDALQHSRGIATGKAWEAGI